MSTVNRTSRSQLVVFTNFAKYNRDSPIDTFIYGQFSYVDDIPIQTCPHECSDGFPFPFIERLSHSQMLHVRTIYLHLHQQWPSCVGQYTSTMVCICPILSHLKRHLFHGAAVPVPIRSSQVCAAVPQPPAAGRCQPAARPLPLPSERLPGRAARRVAGAGVHRGLVR